MSRAIRPASPYNDPGGTAKGLHLMPGTILVVDDEKNIVQLARLYLNNEGFRVEAAHDGKQALEKAAPSSPTSSSSTS